MCRLQYGIKITDLVINHILDSHVKLKLEVDFFLKINPRKMYKVSCEILVGNFYFFQNTILPFKCLLNHS